MRRLKDRNKAANHKTEEGFSLIELSLVLIITGIILAGALQYYSLYRKQSRDDLNYEYTLNMKSAIAEHYTDRGRYPCPTDPSLPPSHPNYGIEMCPGKTIGGVTVPNIAIGTCWGQLCRVPSQRQIDLNGDGTNDQMAVLVGAFPIRKILRDITFDGVDTNPVDVDFPAHETMDSYRNKFVYAVTEFLTDQSTFNNNLGAVTINDEFGNSLLEPDDSAHYAIVSMGANGRGAYNSEGNLVGDSCDPGTVPATYNPLYPNTVSQNSIEYENCNYNTDAVFVSALKNEAPGDDYNDDLTSFETWYANDLWAPSPVNPVHVYNVNIGNVGVGVMDPVQRLDISGDVQAANALATEFCNSSTGTGCFDTRVIAGEIASGDGMECPTGYAMRGIENGAPICDYEVIPSATTFSGNCPAGPPKQYMVGVRSDGTIICEPL